MASSYSTDLKLELMVTGENAGTWGDKTNTNLNLVQQAIAGVEAIALSDGGDVTLVMSDAAISNARNMVLKLTGTLTGASTLSIPDSIEKFYIIDATAVTGATNLTVKTVSGTGFTLDQAKIYACYSDGTNITEVSLDTLGGSIGTAGIDDAAVTTAKISNNAITTAKISDNQITTAKISDNQITTAKISANQVTSAEIADDAVGPDQLSNTAVTPGSYTTADITVDAQGRITAATSGEAGGATMIPTLIANAGSSGTHNSNASKMLIYARGAQGGPGGPRNNGQQRAGGPGGPAVRAILYTNISAPFSGAYTVGNNGNPGQTGSPQSSNPGNAGNTTSLAGIFTMTGGGAGPRGNVPGSGTPPGPAGSLTVGAPLARLGPTNGSSIDNALVGSNGNASFFYVFEDLGT